jgi:hypothetical protein
VACAVADDVNNFFSGIVAVGSIAVCVAESFVKF